MPDLWSFEEYCSKQKDLLVHNADSIPTADADDRYWSTLLGDYDHETTRGFLTDIALPTVHPYCIESHPATFVNTNDTSIPPMGSLKFLEEIRIAGSEHGSETAGYSLDALLTLWYWAAPALLAMGELWLRLFAGLLGPIGIVHLLYWNRTITAKNNDHQTTTLRSTRKMSFVILLTVSSSLILMTDTLYVLQNGPTHGVILFAISLVLSIRLCRAHNLEAASLALAALIILSVHLVTKNDNDIHFGDPVDEVRLDEGLYYDSQNKLVSNIADRWPERFRIYDNEHGATTWMPTGDSRTGLPFIIHKYRPHEWPDWKRIFLEVQDEKDPWSEYIALDISFPTTGHDPTKPIYFVLHGLSGGSQEEYIRDLTIRRNKEENSTVVVMIARGLMDTPIKGWRVFHGARTSDAQAAASVIRDRALANGQVLVGVGYSMGAIIMTNYVASYGKDCALDAAVAVSGGLDMRYQEHFYRAQRLWQPMLAGTLRDDYFLGKFGHRVKEKLTPSQFLKILRATHITEIDRHGVVPLNGFDDLDHYYREMSALGDIPHDPDTDELVDNQSGKIHDVSIPLLAVHSFDDPLLTWRATVANSGFMHPENLVKSGSGNLMLLLTKAGGHVGWALGLWPTKNKWKWMNDVVMSFAQSVDQAKKETVEKKL